MLIGLDPEFDYEKLSVAANVALGAGKVIACNKERSYPGEDQQLMPGCGGMVASVEWCSGRMVDLTIGKPSTFMLKEVSEQLGLAPAEILVVGDTYDTDILMANKFGSPSVIVSSHVYGDHGERREHPRAPHPHRRNGAGAIVPDAAIAPPLELVSQDAPAQLARARVCRQHDVRAAGEEAPCLGRNVPDRNGLDELHGIPGSSRARIRARAPAPS